MSQTEDENVETTAELEASEFSDLLSREKPFKWGWMMRYCKLHKLPPAQKWAWDRAEDAFISAHGDQ